MSIRSFITQMFCTNDVSVAEKICDPKIKVHNLLLSQETDGIEDFKKSLADIFSGGSTS